MTGRVEGQANMPPLEQPSFEHKLHTLAIIPPGAIVYIAAQGTPYRPQVQPAVISNSPLHGLRELVEWTEYRYVIHIALENAVGSAALDIDLQALEALGGLVEVTDHLRRLAGFYETLERLLIKATAKDVGVFNVHACVIVLSLLAVACGA